MKNLILTFTLLVYIASLNAQDYAVVDNMKPRIEHKVSNNSQLAYFTSDVILNEKFRYRDFLKKTKNTKVNFHINGETHTKMELTKLLRKAAIASESDGDFQKFLINTYPQFLSVLSDKEVHLLYEKFRKGTLKSYFQDLAENW